MYTTEQLSRTQHRQQANTLFALLCSTSMWLFVWHLLHAARNTKFLGQGAHTTQNSSRFGERTNSPRKELVLSVVASFTKMPLLEKVFDLVIRIVSFVDWILQMVGVKLCPFTRKRLFAGLCCARTLLL